MLRNTIQQLHVTFEADVSVAPEDFCTSDLANVLVVVSGFLICQFSLIGDFKSAPISDLAILDSEIQQNACNLIFMCPFHEIKSCTSCTMHQLFNPAEKMSIFEQVPLTRVSVALARKCISRLCRLLSLVCRF